MKHVLCGQLLVVRDETDELRLNFGVNRRPGESGSKEALLAYAAKVNDKGRVFLLTTSGYRHRTHVHSFNPRHGYTVPRRRPFTRHCFQPPPATNV